VEAREKDREMSPREESAELLGTEKVVGDFALL